MPATIFTWKEPASRPLIFAGAISEIYIGPTTEEAPTAMPPRKRKVTKRSQIEEEAQPIADKRYRIAMPVNTFFRPYRCAGAPEMIDPITVPMRLDATVNPCQKELSCQRPWMVFSAPDITAVSNPNRNPPNAAISAMRTG